MIKADRNDLSYVSVEITDKRGNVVPNAIIPVEFTTSGPGKIAASGNANPSDTSGFQKPGCNTFRGRGLVILRPNGPEGKVVLRAKASGLKPAKITVITNKGNNL